MSADDGFLSRWARRKAEAKREEPLASKPPVAAEPAEREPFDLASLPSLDDLTATSDVSLFLKKGVPEALRNAALRKVWATDPAIRDYIGPADFQWDFHAEGAITGFGNLPSGTDIARLVSDVTEYHLKPAPEPVAIEPSEVPESAPLPEPRLVAALPDEDGNADAEEAAPVSAPLPPPRRRHGGATPR